LNIGDYSEDIYLESSSGYNERLTLDLRVFKQAPDWDVDETQFSSSMNIISQVRVRDIFSTDPYDMIAAFADDTCRGVAKMEYKENYDDYFAFLVVYGNEEGTELEYKFWDASEGKIYTDVTPEFNFEPNGMYGTMADPTIFDVGLMENNILTLNDGWKWMSFNLDITEPGINSVFSELAPKAGDVIKHEDKFAAYDPASGQWIGSMTELEIGKLYRMKYSASADLTYEGAAVDVNNYPVDLIYGWNRIGFIPSQNMTVSEALAGFTPQTNDVIKGQYQFAMYDGYDWIGSLEYMEPGKGYMYNSLNSDTVQFIYPELTTSSTKAAVQAYDTELNSNASAEEYEYAFSILARIDGPVSEGDEVQAYMNDQLMGKAQIRVNGAYDSYAFITVFGNQEHMEQEISFKMATEDGLTDLMGTSYFEGNDAAGTFDAPVVLGVEGATGMDMPLSGAGSVDAYPNPFSDDLTLSFSLPEREKVIINLYNLIGEHISKVDESEYPAGTNRMSMDKHTDKLESGVYFLRIQTDSFDKVIKIIKK
jgi:hypothetical protein